VGNNYICISVMTSLRVFCIVMDMTVNMFCLRCCCYRASTGLATANTYTHTHNTLLCAWRAAAGQYSVHKSPVADLLYTGGVQW